MGLTIDMGGEGSCNVLDRLHGTRDLDTAVEALDLCVDMIGSTRLMDLWAILLR